MIKAIETYYNGYRFRSRLEARWAVFFDLAGIEYQYELEGYKDVDAGLCYLPDFYIPGLYNDDFEGVWIEVKPFTPSERELTKAAIPAREIGTRLEDVGHCYIVEGDPFYATATCMKFKSWKSPFTYSWKLITVLQEDFGDWLFGVNDDGMTTLDHGILTWNKEWLWRCRLYNTQQDACRDTPLAVEKAMIKARQWRFH